MINPMKRITPCVSANSPTRKTIAYPTPKDQTLPNRMKEAERAALRWTPETGQVAKRESSLGAA
jgi:hypothetical protein